MHPDKDELENNVAMLRDVGSNRDCEGSVSSKDPHPMTNEWMKFRARDFCLQFYSPFDICLCELTQTQLKNSTLCILSTISKQTIWCERDQRLFLPESTALQITHTCFASPQPAHRWITYSSTLICPASFLKFQTQAFCCLDKISKPLLPLEFVLWVRISISAAA